MTLGLVPTDPDIRVQLAKLHVDELIAQAERARMARSGRPPRVLLRVRALRVAARCLRVEREIEFETARVPGR